MSYIRFCTPLPDGTKSNAYVWHDGKHCHIWGRKEPGTARLNPENNYVILTASEWRYVCNDVIRRWEMFDRANYRKTHKRLRFPGDPIGKRGAR